MRTCHRRPAADQKGTRPTQSLSVLAPPVPSPVSLWDSEIKINSPAIGISIHKPMLAKTALAPAVKLLTKKIKSKTLLEWPVDAVVR